jgi:hypothetical protein
MIEPGFPDGAGRHPSSNRPALVDQNGRYSGSPQGMGGGEPGDARPDDENAFLHGSIMARRAGLPTSVTVRCVHDLGQSLRLAGSAYRLHGIFESLGTVKTDGETASFAAPESGTGLVLGRNETSTSFMPLHGLTGS